MNHADNRPLLVRLRTHQHAGELQCDRCEAADRIEQLEALRLTTMASRLQEMADRVGCPLGFDIIDWCEDRIEALEADMDQITGLLAGVETLYTTSEVLALIDLLPSVQAAWERNLGGAK